jgi:hypothetical protein
MDDEWKATAMSKGVCARAEWKPNLQLSCC